MENESNFDALLNQLSTEEGKSKAIKAAVERGVTSDQKYIDRIVQTYTEEAKNIWIM